MQSVEKFTLWKEKCEIPLAKLIRGIGRISIAKNGYTTKSNLHVQWNSHQNPKDIHHRDWRIYPKVYLDTQQTMNSQGNTGKKSNGGGITTPDFKLYYRNIQ
jgi:hypothetical protein